MSAAFERPGPDEYQAYYGTYIDRVPPGDLLPIMHAQLEAPAALLGGLDEVRAGKAYAPGKWSVKQVLGHVIDTERVFSYRVLSVARSDPAELPGFDQQVWVPPASFDERRLDSLLAEWHSARRASLALLEGLPAGAPTRRGRASGCVFSVRALAYVLPGHLAHHLEVLRSRYLSL